MGMSASQVRLLTITKRIHSVENEAERIQNQKMLLGLQSDEAYEEYLAAMEKMNIEYAYFDGNTGNFDWDKLNIAKLYTQGYRLKIKVPEGTTSAVVSRTVDIDVTLVQNQERNFYNNTDYSTSQNTTTNRYDVTYNNEIIGSINEDGSACSNFIYAGDSENTVYNASIGTNKLKIMGTKHTISGDNVPSGFPEIWTNSQNLPNVSTVNFDGTDYTVNLSAGTMTYDETVPITPDADGWAVAENFEDVAPMLIALSNMHDPSLTTLSSDALTDPSVLRELVYNAYAIIQANVYDEDSQTRDWADTSVATNTGLREKTDKDQLAIAEANYEAALRRIDKKEEYYDKELAKFDQERKALTTQLETLKTCIKENIDRTFKIFQG